VLCKGGGVTGGGGGKINVARTKNPVCLGEGDNPNGKESESSGGINNEGENKNRTKSPEDREKKDRGRMPNILEARGRRKRDLQGGWRNVYSGENFTAFGEGGET